MVILSPLSSGLLCYCNCRLVLEVDEPRLLNQKIFSPVLYLVGYETLRKEMIQGFLIYSQVIHVHESGVHGYVQNGFHVTVIVHGVAFLNFKKDVKNASSGKQTKH